MSLRSRIIIIRYYNLELRLILLGRMLSGSFDALMAGLHTYSYIMYVIIILAVLYVLYRIFLKIETASSNT